MKKKLYFSIGLLVSLFLHINSFSQLPNYKVFNESLGFQNTNYITDIHCDREGSIWIVNFSGLMRYDGKEFHQINTETVSHANFLRIKEAAAKFHYLIDYQSKIFLVQADTLSAYPFNDKIVDLAKGNSFIDFYFDAKRSLHISFKKEGYFVIDNHGKVSRPLAHLTFSSQGQVCLLRKNASPFMANVSSNSIEGNKKSKPLVYLLNEQLKKVDSTFYERGGFTLPNSISTNSEGVHCFSNGQGLLFTFDSNGFKQVFNLALGVVNVFYDDQDQLWVGTLGDGLKLFQAQGFKDEKYQLFPNATAIASCQDTEGGIWVYSAEKGLIYIPYPNLLYFNNENGTIGQKHVSAIHIKDTTLYLGGENNQLSILKKRDSKWATDSMIGPFEKGGNILDLYFDQYNNSLWSTQRGAISRFKKGSWKSLKLEKLPKSNPGTIYRFVKDDPQSDWLTVFYDQRYFKINNDSIHYVSKPIGSRIYEIIAHDSTYYFNTDQGIYYLRDSIFIYLGDDYPLLAQRAYSITSFLGKLWISIRNKGVHYFDGKTLVAVQYQGETLKKGAVIKVSDQNIWIVARQATFELIAEGDSFQLKAYARLPQTVAGQISANREAIFWGTWNQGLFMTPFEALRNKKLKAVPLKLDELIIDGKKQLINDQTYTLDHNQSYLQLKYKAVTYQNWEVSYRHRLIGLSKSWNETKERSLQYTTLPPGKYQFELQARKGEQLWSDPIKLDFIILPPIWKRWWFILSAILLLASLTYGAVAYRFKIMRREKDLVIQRLKAEQNALRAQMNPHFVFNILSSVQYLVLKNDNQRASNFLNLFAGLMRKILDYSNTNLISVAEEQTVLKDYLELEKLRMENSFDYTFEVKHKEQMSDSMIPPFLVQPFLENALHHGLKNKDGVKRLKVSFWIEKEFLWVEITDNGVGREAAAAYQSASRKKRKSHAIRIIAERLSLHNKKSHGNIIIEDLKDQKGKPVGTTSKVRIKTAKDESINY